MVPTVILGYGIWRGCGLGRGRGTVEGGRGTELMEPEMFGDSVRDTASLGT